MINMSYCRFENTFEAICECLNALEEQEPTSEREQAYARRIAETFEAYQNALEHYEPEEDEESC